MLAGTILATANYGLEGSRPELEIIPVKFFDADTRPQAKNAAPAIQFAVDEGADIIELSWELGTDSREVHRAIGAACRAGKLVVFAAGNHGNDIDEIPAFPSRHTKDLCEYDGCERDWSRHSVTVMASDRYDEPAWFSNYGRARVDLAAPGAGVISTCRYHSERAKERTPGGRSLRRCHFSGTSAASAHVAGAAGLLWALYPDLTADQLKRCLVDSVEKRPALRCASGGRLYLRGALKLAEATAAAKSQVVSRRA
jgi:subtilisin family serine protease